MRGGDDGSMMGINASQRKALLTLFCNIYRTEADSLVLSTMFWDYNSNNFLLLAILKGTDAILLKCQVSTVIEEF